MKTGNVVAPPRLRMFAGPNGSGKTSVAHKLAREYSPYGLIQLRHFINADVLNDCLTQGQAVELALFGIKTDWRYMHDALMAGGRIAPDHRFLSFGKVVDSQLSAPPETCDPYVAAAIADFIRDELLAAGVSFSFETVMSHRSKVDFFARARAAGYRTYLYFVATESPDLNARRIGNRLKLGGHAVPAEKIVDRYWRSLALVKEVVPHAVRAFFFDNSGAEPLWLAEQTPEGKLELKIAPDELPGWFQKWVAPHFGV